MNPNPVLAITSAEPGETATEIGRGTIVIAAAAERVVSATEVAVRVTVAFAGTEEGGVYVVDVPLAVAVDATDPHVGEHGAPPCIRDQTTPALLPSYCTAAAKL